LPGRAKSCTSAGVVAHRLWAIPANTPQLFPAAHPLTRSSLPRPIIPARCPYYYYGHDLLNIDLPGCEGGLYLWKVTCLGLTCLFFTSTLLPHSTTGMFSHTLHHIAQLEMNYRASKSPPPPPIFPGGGYTEKSCTSEKQKDTPGTPLPISQWWLECSHKKMWVVRSKSLSLCKSERKYLDYRGVNFDPKKVRLQGNTNIC